jgi:hypothetical protein
MAVDLVASRSLQGKTMPEVRGVLGPPDCSWYGGQTIRYKLGPSHHSLLGRPDPFDLVVRFDKGDQVFSVTVEPAEAP